MLQFKKTPGGFTLVEALITLAILAILVAMAAPALNDFFVKGRVKRATVEVQGLLAKAKAETVIRDADLSVSIKPGASETWCVGFAETPDCDCAADPAECVVNVAGTDVTQVITGAEYPGVGLTQNFASTGTFFGTTFDAVRGDAPAGTITLTSGSWALGVTVSPEGRIRICGKDTSTNSMGYPACPP